MKRYWNYAEVGKDYAYMFTTEEEIKNGEKFVYRGKGMFYMKADLVEDTYVEAFSPNRLRIVLYTLNPKFGMSEEDKFLAFEKMAYAQIDAETNGHERQVPFCV